MELHHGKPNYSQSARDFTTADELYGAALEYTEQYHEDTIQHFRQISFDDIGPREFWREYIWTVCASGFNAKVVTTFYESYALAIGPWDSYDSEESVESRALHLYAHENKLAGILKCRKLMQALGWKDFRSKYLSSEEAMTSLPYIGSTTKYHLARNLGFSCVKPDLHLVRLARYYRFDSPLELCTYLSRHHGDRLGVVDFVLWAWSAAFGTKDIEESFEPCNQSSISSSTVSWMP